MTQNLTAPPVGAPEARWQPPADVRPNAVCACGEWLAACLKLGWRRADLDWLESLWWKYHDAHGNLIERLPESPS